jgi:hypothetical protein
MKTKVTSAFTPFIDSISILVSQIKTFEKEDIVQDSTDAAAAAAAGCSGGIPSLSVSGRAYRCQTCVFKNQSQIATVVPRLIMFFMIRSKDSAGCCPGQ